MKKKILMAALAAAALLSASDAAVAANVYNVGGLSVSDLGTVNPASAPLELTNSSVGSFLLAGQASIVVGQYPDNIAFDPYGTSDATHNWLALSPGNVPASATFSFTGAETSLSFVWGSPSLGNSVSLYSGLNGTGTLIGTITSDELYAAQAASIAGFGTIANSNAPGDIISIATTQAFESAVFNSANEAFEVGSLSAVPLPGALPMFVLALAGIAGFSLWNARRSNNLA